MGNYINSSLVKGERVVYEAHYHWTVWVTPIIVFVLTFLPIFICLALSNTHNSSSYYDDYYYNDNSSSDIGILWIYPFFGFVFLLFTYIKVVTDEFAVTTQRLIIKTGIISRTTLEINLMKVETVSVSQGIIDRLFGGGTLECRGTGSTRSRIRNVAEPYEFRKAFQDALDRYSNNNVDKDTPSATPVRDVSSSKNLKTNITQKLFQLKELLDSGILTQEEFDTEKKKILNQ